MHMFNGLIVFAMHFDNVSKLLLMVVIVFIAVFHGFTDLGNIMKRSHYIKKITKTSRTFKKNKKQAMK